MNIFTIGPWEWSEEENAYVRRHGRFIVAAAYYVDGAPVIHDSGHTLPAHNGYWYSWAPTMEALDFIMMCAIAPEWVDQGGIESNCHPQVFIMEDPLDAMQEADECLLAHDWVLL